mmetsp:Transcript_1702/g.3743  ORF Transcript_1702/g.3743 Transcript_1702/m.3743 type:complete len:198 (-) Transcript_1702:405-998(-)|eukprot:CAMPEP_0206453806 /NCGR_PEP_ID=MMETSP0324_2-20121206/20764_1 /ASSEMBLY_ACC=CAM_ASM_000836 /TAXON_ID=2866 /ORGANISM="Crypthecodinium cohnii, Strain Seligo" /LENGTH=197 /DNA_ID=CAMNT_0053924165 /DNA_START=106 /DNA_END=699 /DNA_ORIENTATION=+
MSEFTAVIETVEVVNQVNATDGVLNKGLGALKSRISLLPQGQHAMYNIRVTNANGSSLISKRFSEFAQLHTALKDKFGASLPMDLPGKTLVRRFDPQQLEDRKHALNCYLKELCRSREIVGSMEVQRFFGEAGGQSFEPGQVVGGGAPAATAPVPGPPSAGGSMPPAAPVSSSNRVPAPVAAGARHDPDDDLVGWDR